MRWLRHSWQMVTRVSPGGRVSSPPFQGRGSRMPSLASQRPGSSVPLLHIVPGAREIEGREFALQSIDQRAMAGPIVKRLSRRYPLRDRHGGRRRLPPRRRGRAGTGHGRSARRGLWYGSGRGPGRPAGIAQSPLHRTRSSRISLRRFRAHPGFSSTWAPGHSVQQRKIVRSPIRPERPSRRPRRVVESSTKTRHGSSYVTRACRTSRPSRAWSSARTS